MDETTDSQPSNICKICLKQPSKYTCPRCHITYCSSTCYKSEAHAQCSETFYKECFMGGLKDIQSSPEERQKVLEMLSRLEDQYPVHDSDDDDSLPDLEERIQGLDLDKDTDEVWDALTPKERKEFQDMVGDGRLGNLVEQWEPWWENKDKSVIEEINSQPKPAAYPAILTDIPMIDTLLNKRLPSDVMPFTVVNVLYSYAYIARLHNGDLMSTPQNTAEELDLLCGCLGSETFCGTAEAIQGCIQCLHNRAKSVYTSQGFSVAIIKDVISILTGPSVRRPLAFVMSALSDLHRIFTHCKKHSDRELKRLGEHSKKVGYLKTEKTKRFGQSKKMVFLLSWVQKYGIMLASLIPVLELEFCSLSSDLAKHKESKETLEKAWKGNRPPKMHKFIEEIADR